MWRHASRIVTSVERYLAYATDGSTASSIPDRSVCGHDVEGLAQSGRSWQCYRVSEARQSKGSLSATEAR